MGEIGSGTGTSYPGALDTESTLEVNSPSANKTRARAEVINDLAAAVVALQTELGTDPAGTLTDVKTFMQKEHNTDGTHVGTVNVETYASFAAAVSSIGSTEKTLIINTNQTVSTAVTVPSTLHVVVRGAGKFTKSGSGTLTINGPFDAPLKQVFSGFAAGDVTFGAGSVTAAYPDWWGTTENTILSALSSVREKYIPVRLLQKTYQFSSKMSITAHGEAILGPNQNKDIQGNDPVGAVLEYTGSSGVAIEVGVAPDTNGNFIQKITLDGFFLKVTEDTTAAIRLWHTNGRSQVRNIVVFGNSDKNVVNNVGILMEGTVDTIVENVLVKGTGTAASSADWLQYGMRVRNGFGGSPTTTTRIVRPYLTQCMWGISVEEDSSVQLLQPAMESNYDTGLLMMNNARVAIYDPWLEDNATGTGGTRGAIRIQSTGTLLNLFGGRIDIGALQYFVNAEGANRINFLGGTVFASSHANPILISTGGEAPIVAVVGENIYATSMKIWEAAFAGNNSLLLWRDGALSVGGDAGSTLGIKRTLSASTTWDPPSVGDGAQTTTTITVTGAAVGDVVSVGFSQSLQGMQLTGYVSATDTVTVVLRNGTGGAIDLASGTLRASVTKY